MSSWQQVLALDAKYNHLRTPSDPSFKRLYLRRRSHLLRCSKNDSFKVGAIAGVGSLDSSGPGGRRSSSLSLASNPTVSNSYLQTRTVLLQQRYKVSLDQLSHKSSRPPSRINVSGPDSTPVRLNTSLRAAIAGSGWGGGEGGNVPTRGGVVPTHRARASRAIVGGATLGENYAFSGVHHIFDQHRGGITQVKFGHNDASLLCCSSEDGTASVCRADDDPRLLHTLRGHGGPVMGVDWSSSNDLLATCSSNGSVCVWQTDTGTCLRTRQPPVAGATAMAVLFHPLNSNWVVVGGGDGGTGGVVQVVGLSTGRTVGSVLCQAPVTALACDCQGTTLWAGDDKGGITAMMLVPSSGELRKGRRCSLQHQVPITGLEHRTWASREARDPSLLVSAACDALLLYSVVDGAGGLALRRRLPIRHRENRSVRATFPPLMSFHEGAAVVSGSEDGSVVFLDVERPQRPLVNRLQGHATTVTSPAFNYTESLLATGDQDGVVIVWKRRQGAE